MLENDYHHAAKCGRKDHRIMNAPSTQEAPAVSAIALQRPTFSLAPQNLTEAMKFAEMMSSSELVPKNFRGKPGDVLIAVEMGREIGLSPMAAIQNIAVINSKPGIYGDAGKAVLLAGGCIIEEDDIEIIKATGRARCKVTRKGRPPVERTYSLDNAKTAGLWNKEGPWRTNPERQMAWRAFWFAARDAAADLLKGIGGAEELVDYTPIERDITPATTSLPAAKPKPWTADAFAAAIKKHGPTVTAGTKTAEALIAWMVAKHPLTAEQEAAVRALTPKPIEGEVMAPEDESEFGVLSQAEMDAARQREMQEAQQ